MNYIKLINTFWDIRREREDIDPYAISLYFTLLQIANANMWKEFTVYREDITELSGMSPSSYYKARQVLQNAGLITFNGGSNKLSKCSFTVCVLYSTNTVDDTQETQSKNSKPHTTKPILDKPDKPSKPDKPDKPFSLHTSAISAFDEFYQSKFNTKYVFGKGKDGVAMKALLEKIRAKTIEVDQEPTDENVLEGFKLFIESIKDKWVIDNFSLSLINLKFNELFKSAKNGTSTKSKSDHRDYIEYVRQRGLERATINTAIG